MKEQWNDRKKYREQWYYPNHWERDPPNSIRPLVQHYSNDLVESESHRVSLIGEQAGGLHLDIGGNFMAIKRDYSETFGSLGNNTDFSTTSDPFDLNPFAGHYRSPQYAATYEIYNYHFPDSIHSSSNKLDQMGTKAIAEVAPTKSEAELSQAGGEALNDGFPLIIGLSTLKSRAGAAHAAGSEYLNVEFGWKPLISDVKKMAHAILNAESILDEYEANSGKLIRKRHTFPTEFDITTTDYGSYIAQPSLEYQFYHNAWGHLTWTDKIKRRTWFSGAFTYYFPPRGERMRKSAEARKLLGVELTPATLWNLAPWSWAADWFGNVGDVLDAFDNLTTDGLQMPWAYIMEESSTERTYVLRDMVYRSYPGSPTLTQTFKTTTKVRQAATPWGFGFDMHNMTARQWAILVALGLVRGSKP